MSFKPWFGAFVGAGGSWLGFSILIFIWIWSLVFDTGYPKFWLYIDLEGKEYPSRKSPYLGLRWRLDVPDWRFVSWSWFYMDTGIWYPYIPIFGSPSSFWMFKEHPCPLSPNLRLWLGLVDPYWGFASWYWFGSSH